MDTLQALANLFIKILVFIKTGAVMVGCGFHNFMLKVFSEEYHWLAYLIDFVVLGGLCYLFVKSVKGEGPRQKVAILSLIAVILLLLVIGCFVGK